MNRDINNRWQRLESLLQWNFAIGVWSWLPVAVAGASLFSKTKYEMPAALVGAAIEVAGATAVHMGLTRRANRVGNELEGIPNRKAGFFKLQP
jgi:hypothetical protein